MSKVFVKDLTPGEVYTFNYWLHRSPGLVQYVGPFQDEWVGNPGHTWKAHRFLWVKKPKNYGKGEAVIVLYGDNIRGTIGRYSEKG